MFGPDFFPTPPEVIDAMLEGYSPSGKVIFEPSAGKGNIVDYLKANGAAEVIACETNNDLRTILAAKCRIVMNDFFTITSDKVSHIHAIIMNPPFSNADKHILHAWEIAPAGCVIISLCNTETVNNPYQRSRAKLSTLIEEAGHVKNLGNCFSEAERNTEVSVSVVYLTKPGAAYESEFDGFFMGDDDPELHANAIMPYNFIRDLVQRYIAAMKLYDKQLDLGAQMSDLTSTFYKSDLAFSCSRNGMPVLRNNYQKDLQKNAWKYIFEKMNMQKLATRQLREDINKFVEQQTAIPFTMKNIYRMIDIVIGTTGQRMDKALLEVFDELTKHSDENRFMVEGWKTNSHYLVGKKFIIPYICYQDQRWYKGESNIHMGSGYEKLEDLLKALCYISGDTYEKFETLYHTAVSGNQRPVYGEWFNWAYWRVKAYKKGTMHFEFNDDELWGKFNQHIARIKGYPLYEYKAKATKPEPDNVCATAVAVYITPNIVAKEVLKQEAKQETYQTTLF